MSMTIAELIVKVGSDTEKARSGLHAVQENMRQLEKVAERANEPLPSAEGFMAGIMKGIIERPILNTQKEIVVIRDYREQKRDFKVYPVRKIRE